MKATMEDILTLARTIYGEARGEPQRGRIAVAHVVLNRLKRPGWWTRNKGDGIPDDTIAAVCRDPYQFSCWNSNDPNLPKLLAVTLDDPAYQHCMYAALAAVLGYVPDPTFGSCHYYKAGTREPKWAKGKTPVATIGCHLFFNDID